MRLAHALPISALLLLAACGSTTLTRTGQTYPAKPKNCQFDVVTTVPNEGVTEIGTIDIESGAYASNTYSTLGEVKREIAPLVCKAGGDIAVAQANGFGWYIKATILKRTGAPPGQAVLTSAPAPAAGGEGCKFDTQCKGDRICVAGSCVDPQKK